MTEEILIDGVNVAWCKDYDDGTCCNDDVLTLSCEKTNCMFKQLKRLEQENKELKEEKLYRGIDRQFIEDANDRLYFEAKKYRKALEEIREIEELPYYSKGMPEEPLSQRDFTLGAINDYEKRRMKILTKINEVLS